MDSQQKRGAQDRGWHRGFFFRVTRPETIGWYAINPRFWRVWESIRHDGSRPVGGLDVIAGTLATIYATYILTRSEIFDGPRSLLLNLRFFQRLLSCQFCTGMWAAVIVLLMPRCVRKALALAGGNFVFYRLTEE